jgi:hypothetical protein
MKNKMSFGIPGDKEGIEHNFTSKTTCAIVTLRADGLPVV